MKATYTRKVLALVLILVTLAGLAVPAFAATYSYDVTDGAVYTVKVGDTLELYNPDSYSGMDFWDYYWGVKKDESTGEVEVDDRERSATVVATKGGTVRMYSELYGSVPKTNYGQRYNSAKKKWESYTYTTYSSRKYQRYFTIKILDNRAPAVASLPDTVIAAEGSKSKVTVEASTNSGTSLKYQWYYANPGSSTFSKASATGKTYSVTMNDERDGRKVYCVVTDGNGKKTKSETVTLKMAAPVKITAQPKTASVPAGSTAKVTVKASGEGKLKYTWYIKNAGAEKYKKSSVTSSSYSATMTPSVNGRRVYCVVSDGYGQKVQTKTVLLKMNDTLGIYSQPSGSKTVVGQTASATVKAHGSGKLTYAWYVKDPGKDSFSKSSVTKATYETTMTASKDGRQVYCVVKDSTGKAVKSSTATLKAIPKLKITTQPKNTKAAEGNNATVSVKVTGGSGVKYQWYTASSGSSKFNKSSITKPTYSVEMNDSRNGRQVYCVITDSYGQKVKSETVTLGQAKPITIKTQPVGVTVWKNKTASVSVKATGDGTLKYQWYIKNAGSEKFSKSSVTSATYTITMNSSVDGREVYCVISDAYGQKVTTDTVTLNMIHPIEVVMEPEDGGYYDDFEFRVTGTGPLTFVWYVRAPRNDTFVVFKTDEDRTSGLFDYAWSYLDFGFDQGRALRGGELYCIVTDSYGQSVKSRVAQIYK